MIGQALHLSMPSFTDSYKLTHHKIYVNGVERLVSYFEARAGSEFSDETVFFGLQYFLKRFFRGNTVTYQDIPRIKAFCKQHFMGDESLFNEEGWRHIIKNHGGRLPVTIRAVPEGSVIPVSNVLMMIENTDSDCYWLTNFLETVLVQIWYPMTVASLSRSCKKIIYDFMVKTATEEMIPILMPSRLHDFGYRGVSSVESAALGGAAHLVNFAGTDNVAAIEMTTQFYQGDEFEKLLEYDRAGIGPHSDWDAEDSFRAWDDFYSRTMSGFSIPATEHSIMTIKGPEGEIEVCKRLLDQFPTGFVACVSDSYDLFSLCENVWGDLLKDQIMEREGVLVVRPDSGEPTEIVPQVLEVLGKQFGYTTNAKDYKVLPSPIRVIQGDGINWRSLSAIMQAVVDAGWSIENLAFGSGGALLQKMNRDTYACAFKACYSVINGEGFEVYKAPKTGSSKNSKRGLLALVNDNGTIRTINTLNENPDDFGGDLLVEVFRNGEVVKEWTFDEVRQRAELPELASPAVVA